MPIQDAFGAAVEVQPLGYAGMIAEGQQVKDVASKRVTTAVVPFGRAVGRDGVIADTVRLGGVGFEGIAIADKTRLDDEYIVGEMAGILRKGTVWVVADGAVTTAGVVTFTVATGVIGARAASASIVAIVGAKFETAGANGALVRVYLG
jgi:hypothetical protein